MDSYIMHFRGLASFPLLCLWEATKFCVSLYMGVIHMYMCVSLQYSCPLQKYTSIYLFLFQNIYKWQSWNLVSLPRWVCGILGGLFITMQKSLFTWMALGVCSLISWKYFLDTRRVKVYHFFSTSSPDMSLSRVMQRTLGNLGSHTKQL